MRPTASADTTSTRRRPSRAVADVYADECGFRSRSASRADRHAALPGRSMTIPALRRRPDRPGLLPSARDPRGHPGGRARSDRRATREVITFQCSELPDVRLTREFLASARRATSSASSPDWSSTGYVRRSEAERLPGRGPDGRSHRRAPGCLRTTVQYRLSAAPRRTG